MATDNDQQRKRVRPKSRFSTGVSASRASFIRHLVADMPVEATPSPVAVASKSAIRPVMRTMTFAGGALFNEIKSVADLGKQVHQARIRMSLTQQQFADIAGVGRRFVSELEAGKETLEIGKVLQVCKAAGIDIHSTAR